MCKCKNYEKKRDIILGDKVFYNNDKDDIGVVLSFAPFFVECRNLHVTEKDYVLVNYSETGLHSSPLELLTLI